MKSSEPFYDLHAERAAWDAKVAERSREIAAIVLISFPIGMPFREFVRDMDGPVSYLPEGHAKFAQGALKWHGTIWGQEATVILHKVSCTILLKKEIKGIPDEIGVSPSIPPNICAMIHAQFMNEYLRKE